MFKRTIVFILCWGLSLSNLTYVKAQDFSLNQLPLPGSMLSPSNTFAPTLLKGLVIHPDKPFNFDFIVDSGNDPKDQAFIREQSQRMIRYFLAALTIPSNDLWVNLSPYEHDRVITNELGQTFLGRDMLAQDYVLKQMTASLIYPEKDLGKEFWNRVYKKVKIKSGRTDLSVNTFNKVWILPDGADVFEKGNTVFITKARLKVMLDEDYLAAHKHKETPTDLSAKGAGPNAGAAQIVREIILPELEKEVNEGKNFAVLRQIYYASILAKWYREAVQNTLFSKVYFDQNKIAGVDLEDKTLKEKIYQRYIAAYKKGVFNYIRDDADRLTGEMVPRKYFSGGALMSPAMISFRKNKGPSRRGFLGGFLSLVSVGASVVKAQGAETPAGQTKTSHPVPIEVPRSGDVEPHDLAYVKANYKLNRMLWFLNRAKREFDPNGTWYFKDGDVYVHQPEFENNNTTISIDFKNPGFFYPRGNVFLIAIYNRKRPSDPDAPASPIKAVVHYEVDGEKGEKESRYTLLRPSTSTHMNDASRYLFIPQDGEKPNRIKITKVELIIEGELDGSVAIGDICIFNPIVPPVYPPGYPPPGYPPADTPPPGTPPVDNYPPGSPYILYPPAEGAGILPKKIVPASPAGAGPNTVTNAPEPATIVLLGTGAAGLGLVKRLLRGKKVSSGKDGGIDLNQIDINHRGKADRLSFDAAQMSDLMQAGFKGLSPSIIKIVPISNPTRFFEEHE